VKLVIDGKIDIVIVTFKIRRELLNQMDIVAQKLGVTRSELIRQAITNYIKDKVVANE
jgi:metal-responsive CopG/Arc/MetJ family transcriptional regulator